MNTVVIGLGSNIEPDVNIPQAILILSRCFVLSTKSHFVKTAPVGLVSQPDFINGAVLIRTELGLDALRLSLKEVESMLGRERTVDKYGPRTIDLDVVVFNGAIVDQDFYQREFLKNAVLELLPDLS